MHYLHPRSRTTGTLFTATLAVSFIVVALPHLLPCPVDRRQYADTIEMPDGTIKRRRRRKQALDDGAVGVVDGDGGPVVEAQQTLSDGRPKRECPVPKPGGLMGQIMGFERRERERPAEVVVQELVKGRRGPVRAGNDDEQTP
ncbi:hypothetical protein LTR85_005729 [Meristemomyces frigidus]|nr:hypothetical protein LTR85_005729 [Meristemomyces frigidus]